MYMEVANEEVSLKKVINYIPNTKQLVFLLNSFKTKTDMNILIKIKL